jgi:EAL and modified HD-GYP domain-containing signal transduction protein
VDIFLGRQPIFGRKLEVFAYELLYRDGDRQEARITDGDQATSRVLLSAFAEIGLERVIGDRLAFVNLTRGFLVGTHPLPLSCDRLVLEVLETVHADEEVLAGLRRLKGQGYRIALDDFQVGDHNRAFLALADIIKLDVQALPGTELERELERLSNTRVQFLAEKVETQEEYETCKALGIDFFQGYFFARPKLLHANVLPTQRAVLVSLLARLYRPDCTLEDVRSMVECDLAVSYRLLQHINSSLYGLRCRVQSIRDAVLFLGLYKVRSLVSLFLLAAMEGSQPALIETALVRARFAELLGKATGAERTDAHFTAGMFSCLDAMLDVPMGVALERLPLAESVRAALLDGSGEIGRVLTTVLAYERGDWAKAHLGSLAPERLREAFLEAADWARGVQQPTRAAA